MSDESDSGRTAALRTPGPSAVVRHRQNSCRGGSTHRDHRDGPLLLEEEEAGSRLRSLTLLNNQPAAHRQASTISSPSKLRYYPHRGSSFYEAFCIPKLFSLSFLMVMTFAVASICSFLINTATFLYLSPIPSPASSSDFPLRGIVARREITFKSRYGYVPRVLLLLDDERQRSWRDYFPVSVLSGRRRRVVAPEYPPATDSAPQRLYEDGYDEGCIPKAQWQTASFPNCNSVHEISLLGAAERRNGTSGYDDAVQEQQLSVLGEGWFRTTWMLESPQGNNVTETTVLKTLRLERDFTHEFYELHRRDAVAMERLTSSKYVVDVYGYCGQSAINEIATFPYVGIKDLEKFDRRLRGMYDRRVTLLKLQIAASIAQGVSDMHSIDEPELGPTLVHYDLNPRNIALFLHGKPKINDFNIAEFLRYDPETNRTCGFPNRMHQPWWRAPEEVSLTEQVALDEKVDIYSLGSILFHILTTHSPRGKMKPELMEGVRDDVVRGVRPVLPEPFASDTSPAVTAFRDAMDRCFEMDPAKRASAQEVLEILLDALENEVMSDEKLKKIALNNSTGSSSDDGSNTTTSRR